MPKVKRTIIQLKIDGVSENWNEISYALLQITTDGYIKIKVRGLEGKLSGILKAE